LRARCLSRGPGALFGCAALEIDGAAAFRGAATARHFLDLLGEQVIHREFFAGLDGALAEVEDVALEDAGAEVGIATVVDESRRRCRSPSRRWFQ